MVGIAHEPSHAVLNELVRFIVARLDDDHEALKRATRTDAVGLWSAHRGRTETEARREIVGVVQRMAVLRDLPTETAVRECAVQLLRALAGTWAEHPDYRPSWRDTGDRTVVTTVATADLSGTESAPRTAGELLGQV